MLHEIWLHPKTNVVLQCTNDFLVADTLLKSARKFSGTTEIVVQVRHGLESLRNVARKVASVWLE